MHAAVLRRLGAAPRCEQFANPVPRGDEVIVEVRASSLKPVDRQLASGSHSRALTTYRLSAVRTDSR